MSKARRSTITPEQMSFINGVSTLQRAVWRITYKDPYNALMYYFHFSSLSDYLMRLMRLRERCEKYIKRNAVQKWVNNALGLRSDADSKRVALLLKLFNLYEKNKNNKKMILSRALHRWKNQALALENYLLKLKILKLSVSKTAALKEKGTLQRAFDNWKNNARELYRQLLYGKDVDDLKQQQHKNLGARLLLGYFGKVKQISSLRHNNRAFQKWKDQIRNLKAKERIEYQQEILKAKQHMLKHNINKNGEDLINRFKNKYLENIIKKNYSKLLEKTMPNYLNRVLHHYFGVWRNTANALRERDIYRVLQLKNIITYENLRKSENDRYNVFKTLMKWRGKAKIGNSIGENNTKTKNLKYESVHNLIFTQKMNSNSFKEKYEYIEEEPIKSGAFGQIYRIRDKKIKTEYVLKKLRKVDLNDSYILGTDEKTFENEINFLINVKGTNIINIIDYFLNKNEKYYYLILEKMDGDLNKLLKKYKNGMSSNLIRKIFFQLNSGLKIMIEKGKIHRDLKPTNILFSYTNDKKTDFIIKLGDFGLSTDLISTAKDSGTDLYKAPEVEEGKFSNKCDLYSIGIILYMLKTGEYIFEGKKLIDILINQKNNKIKKETDDEKLNNLIKKLVVYDPHKRMEWDDYFNDPFFKINDEEEVIKKNEETNILQSNEFNKLSVADIEELNNFKVIQSNLMKNSNLNINMLDSRRNKILFNSTQQMRGGKPYFPPIGWIGIGLKVSQKI